jgi:hypothetical protein
MNIPNDVTLTEACPITNFVIALGRQLLKEKVKDWLDVDGVAKFCKNHGIKLDGQCPGSAQLETRLKRFLGPTGEFYTADLNVDGYERPNGWDRPFMVKAYRYHATQHLAPAGSVAVQDQVAGAQNAEVAKVGYKVAISSPSNSQSL